MEDDADGPARTDPAGRPADELASPAGAVHPPIDLEDLVRFDPTWCLFWGKRVRSRQLETWIPYLRRSRHRYLILSGEDRFMPDDLDKIAALPNVMVVAPFGLAIDWLRTLPRFRGFLYIGSQPENFRTVNHLGHKTHVYIGHGESGKGTSGYRTGSLYDAVLVASYGAVGRFPRVIRRFVWAGAMAIGTSLVEGIHKDVWTKPRPVRTILYAPTWESYSERGDYTSLDDVAPVLTRLLPTLTERGIQVIFRPHLGTGLRRPDLRALRDALYAAGAEADVSKADAFARADVLISDVSGLTAEFLFTEKPTVLPVTANLASPDRGPAWLDAEYPWVYRWQTTASGPAADAVATPAADAAATPAADPADTLLALLATIETSDPMREARAKAAASMFRGHRSLDEAVETFEIALAIASRSGWRARSIPLRFPFEIQRFRARLLRRRRPGPRARSNSTGRPTTPG